VHWAENKVQTDPIFLTQNVEELFENAPCGYIATVADGTIVQVNQTFLTQTGYSKEWLLSDKQFAELLKLPGRTYSTRILARFCKFRVLFRRSHFKCSAQIAHP
jgi:PAS domain-containing protein